MDNVVTLSKDNKFGESDNGSKRSIQINMDVLPYELKKYFNWRTPTKRYKTLVDRFYGLGSSNYDKFINHLISKGY